ncbi:hypothetical protein Tco_1122667 [Tanacetum coccineum]|uniref:Uncharacterized protein n=1 Tax=Tanacetum coccineum TaxID=301880 RepID=A0ABQ5J171_9ASTR
MDAPPSPNHVFKFLEEEFEEDPQEEPEEAFEEDPKEDPEEELEAEVEEDAPPAATPPVGSPITPPPLSESSSDTKTVVPEIVRLDDNTELLFSNVKYLEHCEKKRQVEMDANSSEIRKVKRRMDDFDRDLGYEIFFFVGWGAMDARPDDGVDGSTAFEEFQPPKPSGSLSGSQPLSPKTKGVFALRRSRRATMDELLSDRVAKAIAEHERNRPNPVNAEGSTNVQGCSHKTFMNGKLYSFNGTKGVVGLRR